METNKQEKNTHPRHFYKVVLLFLIFTNLLVIPLQTTAQTEPSHHVFFPLISRTPNQAPQARVVPSITSGTAPLVVRLDAASSQDQDGSIRSFSWSFGDGGVGSQTVENHIFDEPGQYSVTLTVVDNEGASAKTSVTIQVNEPALMAKYVILFIGDGMGFEHVRAGGLYLNGAAGSLSFEAFPHRAEMSTHSVSGVTDSAAAATAMATGVKVQNDVVGMAIPGDQRDLYSILEFARDSGLSTGLVTTTTVTHATPAGFGAHASSRSLGDEIADDYLFRTRPNVIFGGAGAMTVDEAKRAGYQVVADRTTLLGLNSANIPAQNNLIYGSFATTDIPYYLEGFAQYPRLSEMTVSALNVLDNDPDGMLLIVEGGRIDHASHANNAQFMVGEVAQLSHAVQTALDWAKTHPGTLIVVTADHETGGLQVLNGNGQGNVPTVGWSGKGHTGVNVPVYITGAFEGKLPPAIDNTQIPSLLSGGKFPGN